MSSILKMKIYYKKNTHIYIYIFLFSVFKPVTFNTIRPQSHKTTYTEKRIKG